MAYKKIIREWSYLISYFYNVILTFTTISVVVIFLLSSTAAAQTRGWGRNNSGQLGLGNFVSPQTNPVTLANSGDITGISTGEFFTLFLKADGAVLATGDNLQGQLGDGTQTVRSSPVPVNNLSNVVAVSASQLHSLALLSDGTLRAWGRNGEGELGNGAGGLGQFSVTPIPVINLTNVVAIATGGLNSMALKSDGTVWAWGSNNDGQLGNGTAPNSIPHGTPTQVGADVAGFSNIIAIAVGVNHAVALKSDGTVWVWGSNVFGEIGNGTSGGNELVPVQNTNITGVSQITAGWHFTHALKPDGTVFTWGYNVRGNLGNGTTTTAGCQCNPTPAQTSITNVVEIKTSDQHTLARKSDGSVWAWGWNNFGQLGNGTTITTGCQCLSSPTQVTAAGAGNALIAAGYFHSFAAIPVVTLQPGSNITVVGENFELHFSSILSVTTITVTAIDPNSTGLPVPAGYTILANSPAYDIAASPAITGTIDPCIRVLNVFDQTQFASLRMLHGEGGALFDRTVLQNYQTREIRASVTSLSPFVVAQVAPTAASVSIGGLVMTANGQGIGYARLALTDASGAVRSAITSPFGYYRFEGVQAGQTYILSVFSKRYAFANPTRVIAVNDELNDINFIAENEEKTSSSDTNPGLIKRINK